MKLVIGNKNYSSWSLRAWLLLKQAGIEFEEIKLPLRSESFRREIVKYSPAQRVPVLLDGDFAVWDTLAIAEYLVERFPDKQLWPANPQARARARSVCAEMHAGFTQLREHMSMNIEARLPGRGWSLAVQADIDRLIAIWSDLLAQHGGPFLFGRFSVADAFFAPVGWRFRTYGVAVPAPIDAYIKHMHALPAMQAWVQEALAEHQFLADDEPYRRSPAG